MTSLPGESEKTVTPDPAISLPGESEKTVTPDPAIIVSTHSDGDEPYAPNCDLWMDISSDGKSTYWVSDGDDQRRVRVSAATWRDVARLKSAAELRQLRQVLKDAFFDETVEGTIAHTLNLIAARVA